MVPLKFDAQDVYMFEMFENINSFEVSNYDCLIGKKTKNGGKLAECVTGNIIWLDEIDFEIKKMYVLFMVH